MDAKTTTDYRNALILAYSPVNSVFENEDIKLEIYNEQLYATNKTKKTIFIDLSQCFLINNGSSYPLYSKETDEKESSKAKISSSIDEYLSIAPSTGHSQNATFICNMAAPLYRSYNTTEGTNSNFSEYDKRLLYLIDEMLRESQSKDPKGKKYVGSVSRHLMEDESISNIGATIAYAFNKKAEEWNNIMISTWVSDVIFAPYYIELPKELSKKEKRGFGVKETEAAKIHVKAESPFEFNIDKSPVIVTDWVGDFKKGTFGLYPTKVSKIKKKTGLKILAGLATLTSGGVGALLVPDEETFFKSTIEFDGTDADWGKLNYADKVIETKQTN